MPLGDMPTGDERTRTVHQAGFVLRDTIPHMRGGRRFPRLSVVRSPLRALRHADDGCVVRHGRGADRRRTVGGGLAADRGRDRSRQAIRLSWLDDTSLRRGTEREGRPGTPRPETKTEEHRRYSWGNCRRVPSQRPWNRSFIEPTSGPTLRSRLLGGLAGVSVRLDRLQAGYARGRCRYRPNRSP